MTMYEIVLNGKQDAEPMLTVLHYDLTGSTDLQEFSDAIKTQMVASLMPALVPSVTYTGITARLDTPGSVGVKYPFSTGQIVGTNAETNYYALAAVNVRKLSSTGSRPAQGRIYQGGIPVSAYNADGFILATYQTTLSDHWELMRIIEFDTSGEATMFIKASNPSAPNTVAYNPVTSFQTSARGSKQSRRNWLT